ncbi:MAG: hypothetical protein AAFY50_21320 [Cyanobacteria bacterium J06648_1]
MAKKSKLLPLIMLLSGFLGGNALLLSYWKDTPEVKLFTGTPEFLVWLILVTILFAILPLCAIYGYWSFKKLNLSFQELMQKDFLIPLIPSFLILLTLFFYPSIITDKFAEVFPKHNLPSFEFRVNFIVLFSGLCALPAIMGITILNSYIQRISSNNNNFLKEYFKAKEQLDVLLGIVGLIIGLGTLATGGLQNALTAFYKASGSNIQGVFPPILTVIYGGYFTTILIVLYLNLEISLVELAKSFIEQQIELPEVQEKSWVEEYKKRKKVEEWLGLTNPWINIKSILLIFTPLAGGLISYIIK